MRFIAALLVVFASGCCTLHADYVAADRETYEYAQPKLEEWAAQKKAEGDAEWEPIVKNKGVSWLARIERAEKKLAEEKSE